MVRLKLPLIGFLLCTTFINTLTWQVYVKVTKLTRRSNGPRSIFYKFAAGYKFLIEVSKYNLGVIKHCHRCLQNLAAKDVQAALVYGEKDIIEVLRELSLVHSTQLKIVYERYEAGKWFARQHAVPLQIAVVGTDKIVVASLVNKEERLGRLVGLGVDMDRIVLLD